MSYTLMNSKRTQDCRIVQDINPVLLVGGAPLTVRDVETVSGFSGGIVAADSGVASVLAAGKRPDAVIGDFDSLPGDVAKTVPEDRLWHVTEQDSTDFEKSLTRIDAPLVLALGFTGGRLDHELAVYHGLLAFPERRCVLIGAEDILFLAPPEFEITLPAGSRFSVMPLSPVRAESNGLHWPLKGSLFAPGVLIGTSNKVAGESGECRVSVRCDRPGMLVILPRAALDAAMRSLTEQACAPWPVRAG